MHKKRWHEALLFSTFPILQHFDTIYKISAKICSYFGEEGEHFPLQLPENVVY